MLSLELVIVLILFAVSLAIFFFFANSVFRLGHTDFDQRVFSCIARHINATNTRIMVFVTFLGSRDFLLPANIVLILYFLLLRKQKWYSIKVPVVSLGTVIVNELLKLFFSRPRPMDPLLDSVSGFSFPSGHSMSALTFYGLLIYFGWTHIRNTWQKWGITLFFCLLITAVGLSRVYLRVHYASDVLAGFAMGAVWLILSLWTIKKIEDYAGKKVEPVI